MSMFRILLVDDDDLVRTVLEIRLAREDHLKIIGSVASGEDAILWAERLAPDLIILDLCMPGLSGMDTMRSIIKSFPQIRILVLSAKQSPELVKQAFDTGAAGYVCKSSLGIDLIEAVRAVVAGQQYASPALRRHCGAIPGGVRTQLPLLANAS